MLLLLLLLLLLLQLALVSTVAIRLKAALSAVPTALIKIAKP